MESSAQKIAKIMIYRKAKYKNQVLPAKFWNSPEWKKEYLSQITIANSLLKTYSYTAISNAVNHPQYRWCFSLRNKDILSLIVEEQGKLDKKLEKTERIEVVSPFEAPSRPNIKSKFE